MLLEALDFPEGLVYPDHLKKKEKKKSSVSILDRALKLEMISFCKIRKNIYTVYDDPPGSPVEPLRPSAPGTPVSVLGIPVAPFSPFAPSSPGIPQLSGPNKCIHYGHEIKLAKTWL